MYLRKSDSKVKFNIIDPVYIRNKYAIYSTFKNDVLFCETRLKKPIFCGGYVEKFKSNVFNLREQELIAYISCIEDNKIILSSNLVFKLPKSNLLPIIAILPYASYAMKILREVHSTLGQNIIIVGLNFFSILLKQIFELAGANVYVIAINHDINYEQYDSNGYIKINDYQYFESKNIKVDSVILITNNQEANKLVRILNPKVLYDLENISFFDKGYEDKNYLKGIRYPYSYVRWDYSRNIKYFLYLINTDHLNLNFLEFLKIKINSLEEISQKIKINKEENLILFEL